MVASEPFVFLKINKKNYCLNYIYINRKAFLKYFSNFRSLVKHFTTLEIWTSYIMSMKHVLPWRQTTHTCPQIYSSLEGDPCETRTFACALLSWITLHQGGDPRDCLDWLTTLLHLSGLSKTCMCFHSVDKDEAAYNQIFFLQQT